jgi:release factor glutamine methyltransferase
MIPPIDLSDRKMQLLVADSLQIDSDDLVALQRFIQAKAVPPPQLAEKIHQLASGYPLDYLLSQTVIAGLSFCIPPGVFIPRPETEYWLHQVLVEYALYFHQAKTIVDLCSGTGLVSLIAAHTYPDISIFGLDHSPLAIDVATQNAQKNNILNTRYIESDMLTNLPKMIVKPWILLCNPPYVPQEYQQSVQYEPQDAIYSGADGLDFFRACIDQLVQIPELPTLSVFELDPRNIDAAAHIVAKAFSQTHSSTLLDQSGHKRTLVIHHT